MARNRSAIEDLRRTIDCLPLRTRMAMLEGIRSNEIIVGAYTDRDGGVCPMLAAHRCGGRTNFISFAKAWDRFAHAKRARKATRREVGILESHLEASILADDSIDLAAAIRDHTEIRDRRRSDEPRRRPLPKMRPGDPDRSRELRTRHGWSWLRPFRRLDEYERALERVHAEHDALAERERELV